jgi:hypothetical protein
MAIHVESTNPSTFRGISSLPVPSVVVFPPVGNAAAIVYPAISNPITSYAMTQIIHLPIGKIYGSHFVLALVYGTTGSGVQVTTAPSANAIAQRYPLMPPTL